MPELRLPAFASEPALPSFAPENLSQVINPWSWIANLTGLRVGQVNVYMGDTSNPDLERKILESVGTYGRQIGQIGDAFAVLLRRVDLGELEPEEQDAIDALREQLSKVDRLKRRAGVQPALAAR